MKSKIVFVLALVSGILVGCTHRMSNDEIIVEAVKCDSAGLQFRQVFNYDGTVKAVYCTTDAKLKLGK